MKKVLIVLACYLALVGCGNSGILQEQYESVVPEKEGESGNLYGSDELVTKTLRDIEYKVPKKWEDNSETTDEVERYYDEGLIVFVFFEEMNIESYDELIEEESEEDVRDVFLSGMSGGFEGYKEISTKSEKVLGVTSFRCKADVVMNKTDYFMDVSAFVFKGNMYSFQMLVETESGMDYSDEFESLIKSINTNKYLDTDKVEKKDGDSFNDTISSLKELYKNEAVELPFSEENSEKYFEIVLKTSKELAKRGESSSNSEEFVEDTLFNPFMLSAGYLCNNYDEYTEYGKVGNMAFELIGYIVSEDNAKRDNILEEFDKIAIEHGMEIITLDDSESREESAEIEPKEPIELSTGKYIVGEDIPSGKYDIIGISRGNIRVCSRGKDYGDILSEIIVAGEVVYANARLENGYTVELVSGGKVQLQPK